jgi:SdrD B-like domain
LCYNFAKQIFIFYTTLFMFNLNFFKKSSTLVFAIASLFVTISAGFMAVDYSKLASAAPVYACSSSETLSGINCLTSRTTTPTFELKCKDGYTLMDTSCTKFINVPCSSYLKGIDAEAGFCKFSTTNIYNGEITTYDGRECNGTGYSYYRYNVGLDFNATTGPIVCANTYSVLAGISNFRWMPKNITEITNMETIQTGSAVSPCPSGYTVLSQTQCSRPAVVKNCDAGGEFSEQASATTAKCTPCPAGFFCPAAQSGSTVTVCANGGNIISGQCQAAVKYSVTEYTTGCAAGYIKLDQTCAIKQFRDRDLGCSYFFASSNVFVKAVTEADGRCSTGGRTDFDSTNIFKVSDLNCAGPGTGWYNYNVAFDPLVCGNNYDYNNKAAFRWSADTYTKITGLQKLPYQNKVCPAGWISSDYATDYCYQAPVTITFTSPIPCAANTYASASSAVCTPCPAGSTSPAQSTSVAACSPIPCTNGATNPPSCNVCPAGKVFVNQSCINPCTNGATNPPSCNVCPNEKVLYNGSCLNPCTNGANNPTNCDTCPSPKILSNGQCIIPVVSSSSATSSSVSSSSPTPVSSSSSATPAPVCRIVGKVYLDPNRSGTQDSNETDGNLPAGISIVLAKNGTTVLTATPDINGNYSFENIPCNAGVHTITVVAPNGYTISNSTENGEGTGSNPTTVDINSTVAKTFNFGKDGIYQSVVSCTNGFVNVNNSCVCPAGQTLVNGVCYAPCTNGTVNPGFCTICPNGLSLINNVCQVQTQVVNNYYTYNNPTNNNNFNPTNTFTPNNSVVVNTPAPTIYSAPAPAVVYVSAPSPAPSPIPVYPNRTVYNNEITTVRTGGVNYVIAFIAAIVALIAGVVVSNQKSKFTFNINEWNGSTVSNL